MQTQNTPAVYKGLICHPLDEECRFWHGHLPSELHINKEQFEELWNLHPDDYHLIKIHGREVRTPRWQQAYGVDYHYTHRVNKALPVPALLEPVLKWAQSNIHPALNGALLNWYSADLSHRIGKHRDSIKNLVPDAPIVTVSFGEERMFRLRPWKGEGFIDFPTSEGSLFVMDFATNRKWTHEVPHSKNCTGLRISITLRAFDK